MRWSCASRQYLIHRAVVHWQATQYRVHYCRWIAFNYERVLNAAPFESRWWRFTANHGTGFTDEKRTIIAFDISPSPRPHTIGSCSFWTPLPLIIWTKIDLQNILFYVTHIKESHSGLKQWVNNDRLFLFWWPVSLSQSANANLDFKCL